ncbi:unnamed protein product [Pleuronectes platessa]|uniref:Uncharacterized protein n=1 Tax=Pleuronectes platessa TaxID=8262 RepID=A0A9N7YPB4_PLEPL|nr:unnamed protein product [Pleuronectes platessa]
MQLRKPDGEDEQVCCEALEVMNTVFCPHCHGSGHTSEEKAWQTFIIDCCCTCHSKTRLRGQGRLVWRRPSWRATLGYHKNFYFRHQRRSNYIGCEKEERISLRFETLTEVEYLLRWGPRPNKGFVGLKTLGPPVNMKLCHSAAVHESSIRNGILAIEGHRQLCGR